MKPTNTIGVSVRVLSQDLQFIDELAEKGSIVTRAEFIRQAVSEKVQKIRMEA